MKKILTVIGLMWLVVIVGQIPFIGDLEWYDYFANSLFLTVLGIPALVFIPGGLIYAIFSFHSGLYKINTGCHYSGFRFKPFFENGPKWFSIRLYNGWHSAPKNNQVNKLVGKNWGLPSYNSDLKKWVHKNSLRVGMRLGTTGVFEVVYYGYYEGLRLPVVVLGYVKRRENFQVEISKDILEQLAKKSLRKRFEKGTPKEVKSNFGYYLFPYHGGEFRAHEKCTVDIYKRNVKSKQAGLKTLVLC
jgi:hypothetical protein